jgi:hypothetical protein
MNSASVRCAVPHLPDVQHEDLIQRACEVSCSTFSEHGAVLRMAGEILLLLGEALADADVVLDVLLGTIDDGNVAPVRAYVYVRVLVQLHRMHEIC